MLEIEIQVHKEPFKKPKTYILFMRNQEARIAMHFCFGSSANNEVDVLDSLSCALPAMIDEYMKRLYPWGVTPNPAPIIEEEKEEQE